MRVPVAFACLLACAPVRAQVVFNPYAPPLPPVEVSVRFEPDSPADRYRVTIEDKSCTTPCALQLRPGAAPLRIDGGTRRDDTLIDLPMRPATVRLSFASRANYLSGALALILGTAATGSGVYFAAGADWNNHLPVGIVAAALGATGFIVGIVDLARAGHIRAQVN
jgi:hypothetical protein